MRVFILALSILALAVSVFWAIHTNFDYEPIIVFVMGLGGLISDLFRSKKKDKEEIEPPSKITQKQEVNFNLNMANGNSNSSEPVADKNTVSEKIASEREAKIDSMKDKMQILFIDDDEKFSVVKILKNSGWKKTKSVTDIKSLDIATVKESNIFFVDINGVGKLLLCKDEGLDLALMLKQKYPNKKVVIYSANNKTNAFHPAWGICDHRLEKNALPYQFQSLVEQYSLELF